MKVAVVGVTGVVGTVLLKLLEEREFPVSELITTAQTREEAINKMKRALDEFVIEGVKTTIPFHQKLLEDPDFLSGNYTTKFMESFEM